MKTEKMTAPRGAVLSRLSLRGFVLLATGIAGALALAAVVAMVGYVGHYRSTNRTMSMAIERLWAAEHLQADLLDYHQQAGLSLLAGPDAKRARLADSASFARRVRGNLELAHRGELDPPEARALEQVEQSLASYLAVYRQVEQRAEVSPLAALRTLNAAFDFAFKRIERLIDLDIALSVEAHERARFGSAAAIAGSAIVILLIATLALVIRAERAVVFRPLLALKASMAEFAHGRHRPAPEEGIRDLREIAHTFNEMAEALASNRQAQLRYLSGVAHDLRNPLTALKGAAQMFAPGRPLPSEQRTRELAGLLQRQVERLDRMVGDLLDSTRIEAGRLELRREPGDLRALVSDAVELFRQSSERHSIALAGPPRLPIVVDSLRLSQVLNNLLSNAIKYSPAGGEVRVELRRDGTAARLRVSDAGMGIPAAEIETIFQPFRRSSTSREGIPGVGLGLSVTRRIVEAHGGHIEVESREGQGSAFTVVLPLEAEPAVASAPAPAAAPQPC